MAAANITLIKDCWNKTKQKGILMMNDTYIKSAQTALALTEKLGGQEVMIRSLGTSGILKKAKERYTKG